jgi:hypothetical protein
MYIHMGGGGTLQTAGAKNGAVLAFDWPFMTVTGDEILPKLKAEVGKILPSSLRFHLTSHELTNQWD